MNTKLTDATVIILTVFMGSALVAENAVAGKMRGTGRASSATAPPRLNMTATCRATAVGAINAGRDKDACLGDERNAQDELAKSWPKYSDDIKTQCVGMVNTGGPPSYVELITCLDVMRDAKIIRKDQLLAEPLLNKGVLNTRTLQPTELNEGSSYTDGSTKSTPRTKSKSSGAR
jgi:hypothetical protein